MSQLKAFVGHSFTSEDDEAVRAFLKFLDQVKDMNIGFSWEHAEPAEPKVLADKVLRLMEDKNLFIGICTSKEVAIQPDQLSRATFNKKVLKADEGQFSSKTSDWLIQEIGLAIGRGMGLILLVEKGVRQPGGLQGNLEYITFERSTPEKSFGKVLEMIQTLLPKAKAVLGGEGDIRAVSEKKPEAEEKKDGEWREPKDDWSRTRYEFALMHMVMSDNEQGAQKISETYLASEAGKIAKNRESWEACHEYWRLIFGKGGKLATLEGFAKTHLQNGEVQRYLAIGYQRYEEYAKAAKCFEAAADKAETKLEQLQRQGDAAVALTRSGQKDKAKSVIQTMKGLALDVESGESLLTEILCDVAKNEADKTLLFGLTERLLEFHPDDVETRFSLAYDYSQAGEDELALFHYLKIPYQERGAGTWNNIGVEFDHFRLGSKSVRAYRKSEELGETLAMSNLAQKLIGAGFLDEAEKICNEAVKVENYHKNVGNAISRIKDMPENEDEKEKEIRNKALPFTEFYKDYGRALTRMSPDSLATDWQGPQCKLSITISNGIFSAHGDYEVEAFANVFARAALGLEGFGGTKTKKRVIVKYEGIIDGLAIRGTVSKEKQGETQERSSLLSSSEKSKRVLMIISDDLSQIRVYEKEATKSMEFYKLEHN